jgi:hypothetical protein
MWHACFGIEGPSIIITFSVFFGLCNEAVCIEATKWADCETRNKNVPTRRKTFYLFLSIMPLIVKRAPLNKEVLYIRLKKYFAGFVTYIC